MASSAKLVVVLSVIALTSGLVLGGLNGATKDIIQDNVLKFKKIPAVADIHEGVNGALSESDRAALEASFLANKYYADTPDGQLLFFVVEKGGKPHAVTLEAAGKGFGGDLGIIAAFELETGNVAGLGITTLSETPGVGSHVRDADFRMQFVGMPGDSVFKVKKDKGDIDAITGATISSRAVAEGLSLAKAGFDKNKEALAAAAAAGPPSAGQVEQGGGQ